MGNDLEVQMVLLVLNRAIQQGHTFADCTAFRAHLRGEIKLGDDFLQKLSDEDLANCLLKYISGVVPPAVPTPPPSSSIERLSDSGSLNGELEERAELRPSFEPGEKSFQARIATPRDGSLVVLSAKMCKEKGSFIEEQTVKDYGLDAVDGKVILSWQFAKKKNEPESRKSRRGRFTIVPNTDIPTNLAFGTACLLPFVDTMENSSSTSQDDAMEASDLVFRSLVRTSRETTSVAVGAPRNGAQLMAEILYELGAMEDRKRASEVPPGLLSTHGGKRQRKA